VDQFLARLLDTPNLPAIVRELEPETLHRLVRVRGLDACADIVALATPDQLMRVFDLDLWQAGAPGAQDQFDAARFGHWIEVLVDVDPANAADTFAALDFDFVALAVTRHLRVVVPYQPRGVAPMYQVGGYTVAAIRGESPDALLRVLGELDVKHHELFVRLMNECARLAMRELDEADDLYHFLRAGEQVMSDVAFDREQRREREGFVTPSLAVAFLETARTVSLQAAGPPARDHATRAYFRTLERRPTARDPARVDPVVSAIADAVRDSTEPAPSVRGLLASDLSASPQGSSGASRLSAIVTHMQLVAEQDPGAYALRTEELAYLANALAAGCSCDGAALSPAQAYELALATCNLGLETWPKSWLHGLDALPPAFLAGHDLVSVFQIGWSVLHREVAVASARRLAEVLSTLEDVQFRVELTDLRHRLHECIAAGRTWRARDQLDVIAFLDTTAWAILARLLDECPCVPADLDPASGSRRAPTAFRFVSTTRQIAWAKAFGERLADTLRSR
jgi:hypothetical protein